MKNLESWNLKQYRVDPPIETEMGYKLFFSDAKVYSFEFPLEQAILKTIITTCNWMSTRLSASIINRSMNVSFIVTPEKIYFIQEKLQRPGECLVWQYHPEFEAMRSKTFKEFTQGEYDMNGTVLQLVQYNGLLPPFRRAYETSMKENGDVCYGKGSAGKWEFVHVKTNPDFPWKVLQDVAKREFGNNLVQVFFNEETKKHPDEFVLWYSPEVGLIL